MTHDPDDCDGLPSTDDDAAVVPVEDPDLPDGRYVAVLDRFEGEYAVLLLEGGTETVGELAIQRSTLPDRVSHQDAVFRIVLRDGVVVAATYLAGAGRRRRESAQRRFDRLARRPPGEDDDA